MKNCPFCNEEPEYVEVRQDHGVYSFSTLTIQCMGCGAQAKPVRMPVFRDCSEYTVQDFRDNPSLRPEVEKVLEGKVSEIKESLLAAWNNRRG